MSPQIIDISHPLPFLENNRNYVFTVLEKDDVTTFLLLPIRNDCSPIVTLPVHQVVFILPEEIIMSHIDALFAGYTVKHKNIICVTRNTDLSTDNENQDMFSNYADFMKSIVKKRKRLSTVRLESQGDLPELGKEYLFKKLGFDQDHYMVSQTPLTMRFVFPMIDNVPTAVKNDLLYPPIHAYNPFKYTPSIIDAVREKDYLLSYPLI